jgi:hypothetical protein
MAFGVKREELMAWKERVAAGEIAFLTHYWFDPRFPNSSSVTKVGCSDLEKLYEWGRNYDLKPEWVDRRQSYPHYDLMGERQYRILKKEGQVSVIKKFGLGPL